MNRVRTYLVAFMVAWLAGLIVTPSVAMAEEPNWEHLVQVPIAMDRTIEAGVPPGLSVPVVEALNEAGMPLISYSTFLRTVPTLMAENRDMLDEYPTLLREVAGDNDEDPLSRAWRVRDDLSVRGYPIDDNFPSSPAPIDPGFIPPGLKDAILGADRDEPERVPDEPMPPTQPGPEPGPGTPGEPGL